MAREGGRSRPVCCIREAGGGTVRRRAEKRRHACRRQLPEGVGFSWAASGLRGARPFTAATPAVACRGTIRPRGSVPCLSPSGETLDPGCSRWPAGSSDATIGPSMPSFPEWRTWELSFVGHAEMRMEQRGVTEVDVRAMLERASGFEPNVVEGRYMIKTRQQRPALDRDRRARR